jgi:peptidoglycan/LPS O-acetylase OafA/YrhL
MRIKVLDGFRTIAVLGVLWAHIWMFCGTPSFVIANVDFAKLISFFGTGVDLFFVISGFCMYLMYVSKNPEFNFNYYLGYIKKRWLRIAPAFYVAVLVYGFIAVSFSFKLFNWEYALHHFLFIKNLFPEQTLYAPHFWSLCTEWHFYIVLPIIVWGINRFSFQKTIVAVILFCMVFRFIMWMQNSDDYNLVNYSILNRLIEFVMGIIAARIYTDNRQEWFLRSASGLVIGAAIAFAGRMLMTAGLQERSDVIGLLSRTFNLPLLTLGYALVIVNALKYKSLFSDFLASKVMTMIGKYSYSMYLWHWVVAELLSKYFIANFKMNGFLTVNIIFVIAVIILVPVSKLSYYLFESFYFKKRKVHTTAMLVINQNEKRLN